MENKGILTLVLAVMGTVLVWIPLLFTVAISIIGTIATGSLRFDWLMPAELFLIAIPGALLLFWAAMRAHSYRRPIGAGLAAAVIFFGGGQAFAIVSGLASGETAPTSWPFALAVTSIALYTLALIGIGIAGSLLMSRLYSGK